MHFLGVQAPVTDEFARQHQDWNFVTVALARRGFSIDVDDIDRDCARPGNGLQLAQHLFA